MQKLYNFLKLALPTTMYLVTLDSYRRQVSSHNKDIAKIKASNAAEKDKFIKDFWGEQTVAEAKKSKLQATSCRLEECHTEYKNVENKFDVIKSKLDGNQTYGAGETKDSLINQLNYYHTEMSKIGTKRDGLIKEVTDNINVSDISSMFTDFINNYSYFVDSLSVDQLVALCNILGNYIIFQLFIGLAFVLIGDYTITIFKLDTRYPKLAQFIKMKEKLNKKYLIGYFIIIFIFLILIFIANIYMFTLKYFV